MTDENPTMGRSWQKHGLHLKMSELTSNDKSQPRGRPVNDNVIHIAFTRDDFVRCAQALTAIIRITEQDPDLTEAKIVKREATETLSKIIHMIQTVDAVASGDMPEASEEYRNSLN